MKRLCVKMATGAGKTYVMAMSIALQILNKTAYPRDPRFSKYVFIIAPNKTVKSRLSVLDFKNSDNYYEEKKIVPYDLLPFLRQGKILIEKWHALKWDTDEIKKRKSVDKRGAKSGTAWLGDVLGSMAKAGGRILVINDEAHHAWRHKSEAQNIQGSTKKKEKQPHVGSEAWTGYTNTKGF